MIAYADHLDLGHDGAPSFDCGWRIVEQEEAEEAEEAEGRLTTNSAISASSCKRPLPGKTDLIDSSKYKSIARNSKLTTSN